MTEVHRKETGKIKELKRSGRRTFLTRRKLKRRK